MKSFLFAALRTILLTLLLFVCTAVAAGVAAPPVPPSADAGQTAGFVLLMCLLETLAVTWVLRRSRWRGARLAAAVFVVFYGTTTFMAQIETLVFLTRLPPGAVPRLFLMGALAAAPFSVLAVLVLGKWRAGADETAAPRPRVPAGEWPWRLAFLAAVYVVLYFSFGYYVAWRTPGVPAYYGGVDEGTFLAGMATVLRDRPWLVPFQVLRALLWAAIALPIVRMTPGTWRDAGLAVGVLFAVLMTAPLLVPNAYMPTVVRMAHFREIFPSNFLFGLCVGWALTPRALTLAPGGA